VNFILLYYFNDVPKTLSYKIMPLTSLWKKKKKHS